LTLHVEDKNIHFLYIRLLLDLTRPVVNRWSPLTHASYCMITSRPAVATQMTARVHPAMQPQMPFLLQPYFRARETAQNMTAAYPEVRL